MDGNNPPLGEAMCQMGMEEEEEYIMWRYNMVAQYNVTRQIMDLCDELVRRLGMQVSNKWWEQQGLDLEEERTEVEVTISGEIELMEKKTEVIALN